MSAFQDRLREVLELRGWKPATWAARAELPSDSYVNNWLTRGVKSPNRDNVRKLAAVAGVNFEWLLDGIGPREPKARELAGAAAPSTMRERENFDGSLRVARTKRPHHKRYLWDAIADGDPMMLAPMTPQLLMNLADALVDLIPEPPDSEGT